jgi:cytochrome c oxidase subunit 2
VVGLMGRAGTHIAVWARSLKALAAIVALVVVSAVMVTTAVVAQAPAPVYTDSPSAGTGQPLQGQISLQNPVTPVAAATNWVYNYINVIIIAIAIFVLILMVYVVFRFNEKANPTPSRTTHNAALEVAWTIVPILILVAIAIPSFRLLYFQYSFPKPDLTVKAIGNAWYWDYEYPDEKGPGDRILKVTSNMVTDEELVKAKVGEQEFNRRFGALPELDRLKALYAASGPMWAGIEPLPAPYTGLRLVRQLSVNNEIAVPVGKVVHMLITSNDVIHSWTIPSFGSKMQAVPGRITATWFRADKIGVYYGQCSVLCGKEHSSMPIAVRVVSEQAYKTWVAAALDRDWRRARAVLAAATGDGEARTLAELTTPTNN